MDAFKPPVSLRAPIHNPYDRFTQPEFDTWIDGITDSLRKALGHGAEQEEQEMEVEVGKYDHLLAGRLEARDPQDASPAGMAAWDRSPRSMGSEEPVDGAVNDRAPILIDDDSSSSGSEDDEEVHTSAALRARRESPPHLVNATSAAGPPPSQDDELPEEGAELVLSDFHSSKAKGKQRDPREGPGLGERRRLPPHYLPLSDEEIGEDDEEDDDEEEEEEDAEEGSDGDEDDDSVEYYVETSDGGFSPNGLGSDESDEGEDEDPERRPPRFMRRVRDETATANVDEEHAQLGVDSTWQPPPLHDAYADLYEEGNMQGEEYFDDEEEEDYGPAFEIAGPGQSKDDAIELSSDEDEDGEPAPPPRRDMLQSASSLNPWAAVSYAQPSSQFDSRHLEPRFAAIPQNDAAEERYEAYEEQGELMDIPAALPALRMDYSPEILEFEDEEHDPAAEQDEPRIEEIQPAESSYFDLKSPALGEPEVEIVSDRAPTQLAGLAVDDRVLESLLNANGLSDALHNVTRSRPDTLQPFFSDDTALPLDQPRNSDPLDAILDTSELATSGSVADLSAPQVGLALLDAPQSDPEPEELSEASIIALADAGEPTADLPTAGNAPENLTLTPPMFDALDFDLQYPTEDEIYMMASVHDLPAFGNYPESSMLSQDSIQHDLAPQVEATQQSLDHPELSLETVRHLAMLAQQGYVTMPTGVSGLPGMLSFDILTETAIPSLAEVSSSALGDEEPVEVSPQATGVESPAPGSEPILPLDRIPDSLVEPTDASTVVEQTVPAPLELDIVAEEVTTVEEQHADPIPLDGFTELELDASDAHPPVPSVDGDSIYVEDNAGDTRVVPTFAEDASPAPDTASPGTDVDAIRDEDIVDEHTVSDLDVVDRISTDEKESDLVISPDSALPEHGEGESGHDRADDSDDASGEPSDSQATAVNGFEDEIVVEAEGAKIFEEEEEVKQEEEEEVEQGEVQDQKELETEVNALHSHGGSISAHESQPPSETAHLPNGSTASTVNTMPSRKTKKKPAMKKESLRLLARADDQPRQVAEAPPPITEEDPHHPYKGTVIIVNGQPVVRGPVLPPPMSRLIIPTFRQGKRKPTHTGHPASRATSVFHESNESEVEQAEVHPHDQTPSAPTFMDCTLDEKGPVLSNVQDGDTDEGGIAELQDRERMTALATTVDESHPTENPITVTSVENVVPIPEELAGEPVNDMESITPSLPVATGASLAQLSHPSRDIEEDMFSDPRQDPRLRPFIVKSSDDGVLADNGAVLPRPILTAAPPVVFASVDVDDVAAPATILSDQADEALILDSLVELPAATEKTTQSSSNALPTVASTASDDGVAMDLLNETVDVSTSVPLSDNDNVATSFTVNPEGDRVPAQGDGTTTIFKAVESSPKRNAVDIPSANVGSQVSVQLSSPLSPVPPLQMSPSVSSVRSGHDDSVIVVRKRKRGDESPSPSPAASRMNALRRTSSRLSIGAGDGWAATPTASPRTSPKPAKRARAPAAKILGKPAPRPVRRQGSKRTLLVTSLNDTASESGSGSSSAASRLLQVSRASSVASSSPSVEMQPSPSLHRRVTDQRKQALKKPSKPAAVKRPSMIRLPTQGHKHNHNHLLLRPKAEHETPRLELITPNMTPQASPSQPPAEAPVLPGIPTHDEPVRLRPEVEATTMRTQPEPEPATPQAGISPVESVADTIPSVAGATPSRQGSKIRRQDSVAKSSPVTRSQCRFHTVRWLYGERDRYWVHFIVPGCALGDKEVMDEIGVEDMGDASIEDHEHMVGDLAVLEQVEADLFGELRHLVGVDLLREEAIFYLPKPRDALEGKLRVMRGPKPSPLQNSLSQTGFTPGHADKVTEHTNAAHLTPIHANGSGADAAGPSIHTSPSGAPPPPPPTPKPRGKRSTASLSRLSISSVASILPSHSVSNPPSEDEAAAHKNDAKGKRKDSGSRASSGGDSPVSPHDDQVRPKPRRSRRLGVDNSEYRPGGDTEEDDVAEDDTAVKGKQKRGLKRTRTSMLKEEAQDPEHSQAKRRKRSVVIENVDG